MVVTDEAAEAFAVMISESRRRPAVSRGVLQARTMTTDALKAAWDAFDGDVAGDAPGAFWPSDAPHIEDVHLVLNERGEGVYCAV